MHDPLVVVYDIRLPIPKRERWRDAREGQPRWTLGRRTRTNPENLGEPVYPWWRPIGYQPLIAGRSCGWRWFLTIWHVEPGDADSGTVCAPSAQKWHVHHWRIQWHQIQTLRRRLLTRCTACGGRSTKDNPANHSLQWDREPTPWWRGETGLYHQGCTARAALRGSS